MKKIFFFILLQCVLGVTYAQEIAILDMRFANHTASGQPVTVPANEHNVFPYRKSTAELVVRLSVTNVNIPASSYLTLSFQNSNLLTLDTAGNNPNGIYTIPAGITRTGTKLATATDPMSMIRFSFSSPFPAIGVYEIKLAVYAEDAGISGIATTAALTIGGTSPTDVALGLSVANQALPVRLGDFTATVFETSKGLLNWNTFSEKNTKEFVVEKSTDANNWMLLGTVNSKSDNGQSSWELHYDMIDPALSNGYNYYRIKMVDFDGSFTHSPVRRLWYKGISSIDVYPNPTQDVLIVKGLESEYSINVSDISGRLIKVPQVKLDAHVQLDVSALTPGSYILLIKQESGMEKSKFTIIK